MAIRGNQQVRSYQVQGGPSLILQLFWFLESVNLLPKECNLASPNTRYFDELKTTRLGVSMGSSSIRRLP